METKEIINRNSNGKVISTTAKSSWNENGPI